jgi:DNA helicase-2/ATP-dependent DNA helicase PcrA
VRSAGERLDRFDWTGEGNVLDPIVAALGPGPYAHGVAELVDEARRLLAERDDAGSGAAVELGTHLSASAAIALVASPVDFARRLRRPVPFRPQPRARVGSEFHAWVEHHFEQPALLHPDDGAETEVGMKDLATLRENFLASPWAARRPLAVEVDLETLVAGRVIRCRIDAVFAGGNGVEVVDWKTGRRPATRAELDTRQMQLALYRLAWSRATGTPLEKISAAFFHVAEGVTVHADQWTEARIEERFAAAFAAAGT